MKKRPLMNIVGITSCPSGFAHTPMAAKALEKAGKELGVKVRIEQQGIMGRVNELTEEEINAADFMLLVSNQKVEGMERFKHIPIIHVDINQCVTAADKVLSKCIKAFEIKKATNA
jgi:PTS system fructose-specific IIB component